MPFYLTAGLLPRSHPGCIFPPFLFSPPNRLTHFFDTCKIHAHSAAMEDIRIAESVLSFVPTAKPDRLWRTIGMSLGSPAGHLLQLVSLVTVGIAVHKLQILRAANRINFLSCSLFKPRRR